MRIENQPLEQPVSRFTLVTLAVVPACQLLKVIVSGSCPISAETYMPCHGGACNVTGTSMNCTNLFEHPFRINMAYSSSVTDNVDECRKLCLNGRVGCAAYRFVAKPDRYSRSYKLLEKSSKDYKLYVLTGLLISRACLNT